MAVRLAEELRGYGLELADHELQTTAVAAARMLAGKRVLALTMPAIREDLEGPILVGEDADAVLIGGADETGETNQVFSYMNLARAFAERIRAQEERELSVSVLGFQPLLKKNGATSREET